MAKADEKLIDALKRTALKLKNGSPYMWGHMGSCNCGHLAQEITRLSKAEIHEYAMKGRGDWTEQVMDFCPNSGMPMDLLISQMLNAGLTTEDLANLEKLSDQEVLKRLPPDRRNLRHNLRDDVVCYLEQWARMLEEQLAEQINITDVFSTVPAGASPVAGKDILPGVFL